MKASLFSIVLCFTALTTFAEVTLRGIVTYQNTGEKMKTLQVTARGASPTLVRASTNTEGVFVLTFPNGKVGDLVTVELGTPIYDLVNDPRERNVTLTDNPNYKIRLVVCNKGERDANAVTYYKISTRYLEVNYQKKVQKKDAQIIALENQLAEKRANANDLTKQLYVLKEERYKLDEELKNKFDYAKKMAEGFSRIDLAQADAIYRKAFETFKQGDIEGARQVLNSKEAKQQEADLKKLDADILKSESNIKTVEDSLKVAKQKIADAKMQRDTLKASVIKKKFLDGELAELQNKYDEAERLYTEGVNLDSTNVDNLWALAAFLHAQNEILKAIQYYKLALSLSKDDDLIGTFCMYLGVAYSDINKMPESEKYYLQSLDIFARLSKSNPQEFEPDLASTAMNLGTYYQTVNKMPESEKYYLQSLDIYARLSKSNPQEFEPDLALTAMTLGNYYKTVNKMPESEKYYLQSLDIFARLSKSNPQEFEPDLARTAMNLGLYYATVNKMTEAEKYYLQSLNIYARLSKSNPQQFEPDLARTAMNLGVYHQTINKMPEAEKYYLQSLDIYARLSKSNPQQFEPYLATTAMNLGAYYQTINKMPKAETYYLKALDIYARLSKSNPQQFEPDLALTLMNLGDYYSDINNKLSEAKQYYQQSLDIYERLAKSNPQQFEPNLALILNNYGYFNVVNKQYDKAQALLSRALALRQKALQNSQTYILVEYSRVFNNLHSLSKSFVEGKKESKAIEIQTDLAKSLEILVGIIKDSPAEAAKLYGDLSQCKLFARQYAAAEQSARHGLSLDPSQTWINVNLAHALLFQNKDAEAKKIYDALKIQKYTDGRSYRDVLAEDYNALEKMGLEKKQLDKARKWVKTN